MGALALRSADTTVSVSASLRQRRGEDVPSHATIGRFAAIVFVLHGPSSEKLAHNNMWNRFRFFFTTFCSLLAATMPPHSLLSLKLEVPVELLNNRLKLNAKLQLLR
jgi:hypothetical protein